MIDIAGQVADLVARLGAAGIRACSDLRDLNPPAVYVAAPTIAYRFAKGTADLDWRIVAAAPNTGRDIALGNLSVLLDAVSGVLRGAVTAARPVDLTALDGGAPLPAYEISFITPVRA